MSFKYSCETCQVSMTGKDQYDQHLRGTKHAKKLKLLKLPGNKATTQTSNTDAGEPASGYKGKFMTASDEKSSTPKSTSQTTAQSPQSLKSGQFANVMAPPPAPPLPGIQKQQSCDASVMLVGNDPVMKAVKANLMGDLPTHRPAYQGKCDVCGVMYTSQSHEEQHLSGQKHKKKWQLQQDSTKVNSATFFCGFCNIQVNSMAQMDQHREGSSHQKKVQQAQASQKRPAMGAANGPSAAKKKCGPDDMLPPQNPMQLNESTPVNSASFCGFCKIQVNSRAQMDQHRQGSSHLKKVKQAQSSQMRPAVDAANGPPAAKKRCSQDEPYMPPPQDPMQLKLEPLSYDK